MDYMITIAVIAVFAFILYRKHKKKKPQTQDSTEVQTSELSTAFRGQGSGQGTGALAPYSDGSQTEIYAFNFRDYSDMLKLSADIETKLNRYLMECQHSDRTACIRYVPVGTTLLVECVHTL